MDRRPLGATQISWRPDGLREYLLSLQTEPAGGDGEREPVALTISA